MRYHWVGFPTKFWAKDPTWCVSRKNLTFLTFGNTTDLWNSLEKLQKLAQDLEICQKISVKISNMFSKFTKKFFQFIRKVVQTFVQYSLTILFTKLSSNLKKNFLKIFKISAKICSAPRTFLSLYSLHMLQSKAEI